MITKTIYYFSLICFISIFFNQAAFGQNIIKGTITEAGSNEPLIGASVFSLENNAVGTVTDFNGNYELEIPEGITTLQVSYIGYSDGSIDLSSGNYNLALSEGQLIDEVVVVGYGTLSSKEVTSAITSVSPDEFNKGNVTNPIQLLQGKVAGLAIARPGGNPNATFNIRLRSMSTAGANTQPLIIIDGVIGSDINSINPEDIQSFDVLKDASAAAIYGTRGSSGVILITTKKGSKENSGVEWHSFMTVDNVFNKPDVLSKEEYLSFRDINTNIIDFGGETDWFDEITRQAITQNHSLGLTGGSDNSSYRVSLNYKDGQGIALKNGFDQIIGRANFEQRAMKDRLTFSAFMSKSLRNEKLGIDNAYRQALNYNPTASVFSDEPGLEKWGGYWQNDIFGYYNPVAMINQHINDKTDNEFVGSAKVDFEIIKNLNFTTQVSRTIQNEFFGFYTSKQSYGGVTGSQNDRGFASRTSVENTKDLLESTLLYSTKFSKTGIKLLGGYSYAQNDTDAFGASGGGFLTDELTYNNLGFAEDFQLGMGNAFSNKSRFKTIAFFGRFNLNVDDTYFLSTSIRREGDSRFGANNKWGSFPGVSAGVNLTKFIKTDAINNLKLRGGYGITGGQPNRTLASILRYSQVQGGFFFYNGQFIPTYAPSSNPNPDLKWEVKKELNAGLDFNLFDFMLNGSIDYYKVKTSDVLLDLNVDVSTNLFGSTLLNLPEMEGSGYELSLDYQGFSKGKFKYVPALTFSLFGETKLLKIQDERVTSGTSRVEGFLSGQGFSSEPVIQNEENQPIGQFFVLMEQDLDGNGIGDLDENGNVIYIDQNEDGEINGDDRVYFGNGLPKYQLGLNNTFSIGNFDVNIFFRAMLGHKLFNTNRIYYESQSALSTKNGLASTLDYKDETSFNKVSNRYVEDASYYKLDNMTIGYTFPLNKENRYFKSIKLYVTGQNLLTFTKYTGIDPEVRYADDFDTNDNNTGNPLAPGIERSNTYFTTRGFTFGIKAGF